MTTESENINVSKACDSNALQVRAGSSVNDAGTRALRDTPTAQRRSGLVRAIDSAQRLEKDLTKRMALCLRMNQEVHNPPPAFKARQDGRLRDLNRHRVAAKTEAVS